MSKRNFFQNKIKKALQNGKYRKVLKWAARGQRKMQSKYELLVKALFEKNDIYFRWQVPVRCPGRSIIIDFLISRIDGKPIALEIDGRDHKTPSKKLKDDVRDALLREQGLTPIRVSNEAVEANPECVLDLLVGFNLLKTSSVEKQALSPEALEFQEERRARRRAKRQRRKLKKKLAQKAPKEFTPKVILRKAKNG